jgi:hypothetical protein
MGEKKKTAKGMREVLFLKIRPEGDTHYYLMERDI